MKSLDTGDELVSAKSIDSLIKHHAVVVRHPNTKIPFVYDNDIVQGVSFHKLNDYLNLNNIITITPFRGTYQEKRNIIDRAKKSLGASYCLFRFNCEHFSSYLRTGTPHSRQLRRILIWGAVVIAAALAIVYLLKKKK